MGDPPVAEADEVFGGEPGAALVVVGDDVGVRQPGFVVARDDGRQPLGDLGEAVGVREGADDDEAVDPQLLKRTGEVLAGAPVQPPVGHQHPQTVRLQQRVQPVEHLDEPGVAHIVQQHADGVGTAGHQAAGGGVRPVPELLDGVQHGLPLGVADPG